MTTPRATEIGGATSRPGKRIPGLAIIVVAALIVVTTPAPRAMAQGTAASDGGSTVTVGASGSSSSAPTNQGGPPSSGGGPVVLCQTVAVAAGLVGLLGVGGPLPGTWVQVVCGSSQENFAVQRTYVWVSGSGPSVPPSSPLVVAEAAEASMVLPAPAISVAPAAFTVVNLATWLWIESGIWISRSVTATIGSTSATATATPVSVEWNTGDGSRELCTGPGSPPSGQFAAIASTDVVGAPCVHVYLKPSNGAPSPDANPDDAAFTLTASINWIVTWTSAGVAGGGTLPDLVTTASRPIRVEQIESVVTG